MMLFMLKNFLKLSTVTPASIFFSENRNKGQEVLRSFNEGDFRALPKKKSKLYSRKQFCNLERGTHPSQAPVSPREQETEVLSALVTTFQMVTSKSQRKTFWVVKMRTLKKFTSQRGRERIYNDKFSKENTLGNERPGATESGGS